MNYRVLETKHYNSMIYDENLAYLVEDNWDDWFKFSTMYILYICADYKINRIGGVKIGQNGLGETLQLRRPNIPNYFTRLSEEFFSLGQDDYYYENIKNLGYKIRVTVLNELRDMAFSLDIFESKKDMWVTRRSLLRFISDKTVHGQFHRIAMGGARLTPFDFEYTISLNGLLKPIEFDFSVQPESNPPTNVHVIVGRNGVGKTYLFRNMIQSIVLENNNDEFGKFTWHQDEISRVVFVSFSAFDKQLIITEKTKMPYINVGLPLIDSEQKRLTDDFVNSFIECLSLKAELYKKAMEGLRYDPIFEESGILDFSFSLDVNKVELGAIFKRLSSGHKTIVMTMLKLIQYVEEKTLVFLDEPESHLHPPLLAAFIRSLSELLINRNGVAIIATHSPVILQEVPKRCVWRIRRHRSMTVADRLRLESFGESVEILTKEVFGLEVTESGYHQMLRDAVDKGLEYEEIIYRFNGELGDQARFLLKMMLAARKEEEEIE